MPTRRRAYAGAPIARVELRPLFFNLSARVVLVFQTRFLILHAAKYCGVGSTAAWFNIEIGNAVRDRNDGMGAEGDC